MSKRKAEKQITDRDYDDNSEEDDSTGTWKAASAETMATRRILKAPRKGTPVETKSDSTPAFSFAPTLNQSSSTDHKWPTFSFQAQEDDSTKIPTFSFGSPTPTTDKTEEKTEEKKEVKWPTFSFGSPSATTEQTEEKKEVKWPSFSFGALSSAPEGKKTEELEEKTLPVPTHVTETTQEKEEEKKTEEKKEIKWPAFSPTTEKSADSDENKDDLQSDKKDAQEKENQDDKNQEKKEGEIKWPNFSFGAVVKTEWPNFNFLQSPDKKEWPTFSFSSTSPQKSDSEPFKLLGNFGTLTGIGSNAKETVALTSTGTARWQVAENDDETTAEKLEKLEEPPASDSVKLTSPSSKYKKLENHKTGEEDESTVFEVRAKLFELGKEGSLKWTERGTGTFKVKSRDGGKKCRILMRTDNALRVLVNAVIFPDFKYEKISDKQLRFTCLNTSEDGTSKVTTFLTKVGTAADQITITTNLDKLILSVKNGTEETDKKTE